MLQVVLLKGHRPRHEQRQVGEQPGQTVGQTPAGTRAGGRTHGSSRTEAWLANAPTVYASTSTTQTDWSATNHAVANCRVTSPRIHQKVSLGRPDQGSDLGVAAENLLGAIPVGFRADGVGEIALLRVQTGLVGIGVLTGQPGRGTSGAMRGFRGSPNIATCRPRVRPGHGLRRGSRRGSGNPKRPSAAGCRRQFGKHLDPGVEVDRGADQVLEPAAGHERPARGSSRRRDRPRCPSGTRARRTSVTRMYTGCSASRNSSTSAVKRVGHLVAEELRTRPPAGTRPRRSGAVGYRCRPGRTRTPARAAAVRIRASSGSIPSSPLGRHHDGARLASSDRRAGEIRSPLV